MSNTEIPRYNFVKAWPRALRLALIVLLFLLAIAGGMACGCTDRDAVDRLSLPPAQRWTAAPS